MHAGAGRRGFNVDLSGRTVLVTGASSGIGHRFASALAASGAKVVLGARRVERLAALRATIEDEGGRALAVAMDVCDEASVVAAFDAAEHTFGSVDSVIANTGVAYPGPALDFPRKRIMSVEALCPLALYLCSDASLEVTGSVFSVEDGQTL